MTLRFLNLLALAVLSGLLLLNSVAVVPAGTAGVQLRLGQPRRIGLPPGIYFRAPVLDAMQTVDMRARLSDVGREEFLDAGGNGMLVDAWVSWRLRDLPRYFLNTGADTDRATGLLLPPVREGLRRAFAASGWADNRHGLPPEVLQGIVRDSNSRLQPLGVEILEVGVRRVAFPSEVREVVLARLRSERENAAAAIRTETAAQASALEASARQERAALLEQARQEAAARRVKSEAQVAALQAQARAEAPAFYDYWRALAAWRRNFGKPGDVLVLGNEKERRAYLPKAGAPQPQVKPGTQP